ncbi:MAG: hypothetical protein HYT87_12815 [Nitrospirae bacterium]|nr:hypothetical protein [Nitrospirota bacterium]
MRRLSVDVGRSGVGVMGARVERYDGSRFWAVYDAAGELVCVTVYKKGALEVARRLGSPEMVGGQGRVPSVGGELEEVNNGGH